MDTTADSVAVSAPLAPEAQAEVRARISTILKSIADESESLTDYVQVLVGNNKTQDEVANSLGAFLGSPAEAADFAAWLFATLRAIAAAGPSAPHIPFSGRPQSAEAVVAPKPRVASAVVVPPQRRILRARRSSTDGSGRFSSQQSQQQQRQQRRTSEGLLSGEERPARRGANGSKRTREVEFTVTGLRTSQNPRTKQPQQTQQRPSEEDASMADPSVQAAKPREEEEETMQEPAAKHKMVKCRFFPHCTNPDCPYFHPTEPCKAFPHCKFGNDCFYVHPEIPCRYGALCRDPHCNYTHPPRSAAAAMMPMGPMPMPMGAMPMPMMAQQQQQMCPNGWACPGRKDRSCPLRHPPEACRYGDACTRGAACTFAHGQLCRYGAACRNPYCTFVHEPPQPQPQQRKAMPLSAEPSASASADMAMVVQNPQALASAMLAEQKQQQQQQQQQQQAPTEPAPTAAAASATSEEVPMCPAGLDCDDVNCKLRHPTTQYSAM